MLDGILRWFGYPKPHVQGPPPKGGSAGKPRPRLCKNCGRPLRGLKRAEEIPIHIDSERRLCDAPPVPSELLFPGQPSRIAEWPDEDMSELNALLKQIEEQSEGGKK
jgi:hypothetical protein